MIELYETQYIVDKIVQINTIDKIINQSRKTYRAAIYTICSLFFSVAYPETAYTSSTFQLKMYTSSIVIRTKNYAYIWYARCSWFRLYCLEQHLSFTCSAGFSKVLHIFPITLAILTCIACNRHHKSL